MAGDPRFGRGRSRVESSRSHALVSTPRSTARAERAARSRFRRPRVEQLERRELLATLPVMLGDLSPQGGSSVVNDAVHGHRVVEMDGLYYFAATTPDTGLELWRTDGTPENTEIVVDLVEGPADGMSPAKSLWKGPDGNLYFVGVNPSLGLQRLRPNSNTPEHVASFNFPDLNPFPNQGAIFNGTLYYPALFQNPSFGFEFAKFNFTTGQAELVHDVAPGGQSSSPKFFTVAGDNLYFLADSDGNFAPELWRFDGVQTTWVSSLGIAQGEQVKLVAAEDRLYVMVDGFSLDRLWSVQPDGQTRELLQAPILMPNTMQALGDEVLFGAYEDSARYHVVRTTSGGLDTEFVMLGLGNIADQRGVAHVMDGIYYFFATGTEALGDATIRYLWRSDGTFAGTYRVTTAGVLAGPTGAEMTSMGGMLYFLAEHPTQGFGLWQSDGTTAGTEFVMNTVGGTASVALLPPVAIDGKVFFAADDGVNGRETWVLTPETLPPAEFPDLVASGLRVVSTGEVKWGEQVTIAFDLTSFDAAVDRFQVQVVLSGDSTISPAGGGDYTLDLFSNVNWSIAEIAADDTVTLQISTVLPFVPPPDFNITGRLHIGLVVDPADEIEESDETNNLNRGLNVDTVLTRDVPQVLQVVTHGIDPNFDVSSGFNGRWQWDYPRKLWDLAAATSLAGKTGTYSTIWNSSAGWTRALLDIVALAWLKTPGAVELPPQALAELKRYSDADLQFALERAVREVEYTALRIVQDLHARGDLTSPADRQRIHLIGTGSGAAVNARVAQLLTERGYTISLFSSLDGLAADWPAEAGRLSDASFDFVPAERRINYRVQNALEDPQSASVETSGIEQLASKALGKLLGRAIDPALIPSAFAEWRAPVRPQFENVLVNGPTPDEPTNHFNVADRYFHGGAAAAELAWLAGVPLPTPRGAAPSPVSPLLDDFIDGSFERIPALAAMIDSLAPFAAADEFTKTWLEAVDRDNGIVANDWLTFNDATIAPQGDGHALRLTQSMEFAATNARQSVMVPPNALLTFSLEAFGTLDSNDSFTVSFESAGIHTTVYNGRLVNAGVVGPHAISLAAFAGKAGTFSFHLTGSMNHVNTVMIDNAQIRVAGDISSASAELPVDSPDTLALEASDIMALPGGIDEVRYYAETNGRVGLQIGSDRLLGQATDPVSNWRLETPTFGLKYGYQRLYAVAGAGGAIGPEASVDLFLEPPAVAPYHRVSAPLDVNGDGEIHPIDALIVINALNAGLIGELGIPESVPLPFDTTANNSLEPLDALLIINHLNANLQSPAGGGAEAEGEGEQDAPARAASDEAASEYDAALLALLDLDPRDKRGRRNG